MSALTSVHFEPFGIINGDSEVQKVTITSNKTKLVLTNFGATLISFSTPDKTGVLEDITLCYQSLDEIRAGSVYYGATIGRCANRIANGKFTLNGETYDLEKNNGPNHLHGGYAGFDKVVWDAKEVENGVKFTYISKDGEAGYPGRLTVSVTVTLVNGSVLSFEYEASVAGKETPINLCNHTYWNLSGNCKRRILDHTLEIFSSKFLPVNETQIPTGELENIKGTYMDFPVGSKVKIGERINEVDGGGEPGYDHCYCVDQSELNQVASTDNYQMYKVATLCDEISGRRMRILSSEPGVQLYTGNFLSKNNEDKPHVQHNAVCLETQHYPNSINEPKFPSVVLKPGSVFKSKTVHEFDILAA